MTRKKKKRNVRAIALTGALCVHVAAAVALYLWKVNDLPPQSSAAEMSVAFPSAIADLPGLQRDTLSRADTSSSPSEDPPPVRQQEAAPADVPTEHATIREAARVVANVRTPVRLVLFDIKWKKGGERKKLGGLAPAFPPGLKAGARVQLELALQQDGRVRNVKVVKASDDRMKEPAVRAVRRWRFDLPKKGSARGDQTCFITFHVRVK